MFDTENADTTLVSNVGIYQSAWRNKLEDLNTSDS